MIIGLSGKKQSGKDTVAKIIQYLMFDGRYPGHSHTFDSFSKQIYPWRMLESGGWQTKQFASKLKQIVCLLIGCTLEQLEDNKFKETPLGEEWRIWYWAYISDNKRVGTHIYMSEEEATFLHLVANTIYLTSEILTPRKMLQVIGTEGGRELIHPNIWINALMSDYKPDICYMCDRCMKDFYALLIIPNRFKEQGYTEDEGVCPYCKGQESEGDLTTVFNDTSTNWIITDVRFPNEVKAIEDRNGIVIRINRSNFQRPPLVDNHYSEVALDNWKFEYIISNNGSIEELIEQVKDILKLIKHGNTR